MRLRRQFSVLLLRRRNKHGEECSVAFIERELKETLIKFISVIPSAAELPFFSAILRSRGTLCFAFGT
jgi:hypothetical protein